ncbi:MAG: o-succinylbenzoate synthase [Acidimicrobiales bacterium]
MRVERVVLRRLAMPLVSPFRTSFGVEAVRDVLLVQVEGPDAVGWGECVAMSEPLYSSEYVEGAHAVIRSHLLPRLQRRQGQLPADEVARLLSVVKGHHMAKAALEAAVLDADLRAAGVSMASHLGGVRDRVGAGVSVGITATIDDLLETVAGHVEAGYLRIKLKVEPGWDVEPLRAVREQFGYGLALQVDANAAYTLGDAGHLSKLDEFELVLLEQPLREDDISGHAVLARKLRTPICLDESITSAAVALDAIDRGACAIINVKAGRVGGYLEAKKLHDSCFERGVPLWCGGMLETGIGRAANVALASLPGFTLPGDISASDRYFRRDITEPFVLRSGHLVVPQGPGLGVTPDLEVIDEVTTFKEEIIWQAT